MDIISIQKDLKKNNLTGQIVNLGNLFIGEDILPEDILKLVEERNNARQEKKWAESDRIRDLLISKGYVVKDSKEGTIVEKQ